MSRSTSTLRPLIAALVTAHLIASCGGGLAKPVHRSQPPRMAVPGTEPWDLSPDAARARIETLDREISDRSASLEREPIEPHPVEPGGSHEPGTEPIPYTEPGAATATATCARSPRPTCQDVCSLSDSICDAAGEICELARGLPGDDWAAGRCTAGQASCAQSRERCCRC